MSDARSRILANIAARKQKTTPGIVTRPPHLLPGIAYKSNAEKLQLFCKQVQASSATYSFVSSEQLIPQVTQTYPKRHTLGKRALQFYINSPELIELGWPEQTLEFQPIEQAGASITRAYCGIAETGSVALLAQSGYNSAAYFLPDILIVVVYQSDVLATQEACWARLAADYPEDLPRTLTFVTGPSRTSDIEQQLVIGAHGPRHEHILIIEK